MASVSKFTRGAVAGNSWTTAANATADDGSYTTAAPAKNSSVVGRWDFAAFTDGELPVGATIGSVTFEIQDKASTTSSTGATITLQGVNGGSLQGSAASQGMSLTDQLLTKAYSAGEYSETNLKTAGTVAAEVQGKRSSSNTAITWSVDYVKVTVAYTPNANLSLTATGGGVTSQAAKTARSLATSATGGGVTSQAATTSRLLATSVTGGGVSVIDGVAAISSENHDATFSMTGGGIATEAVIAGREAVMAATGGGVTTSDETTDRPAVLSATGHGVTTQDALTDRIGALGATGGGVASPSILAARQLSLLLSGGGVTATDQSTERLLELTATGGGTANIRAGVGEDHPAEFGVTGGGVTTFVVDAERYLVLGPTGGGVALFDLETARFAQLAPTGAGRANVSTDTVVERPPVWTTEAGLAVTTTHVDIEVIP